MATRAEKLAALRAQQPVSRADKLAQLRAQTPAPEQVQTGLPQSVGAQPFEQLRSAPTGAEMQAGGGGHDLYPAAVGINEDTPWHEKLRLGAARAALEPAMGIKELTVGLDPIEQQAMQALRFDQSHTGGWGAVGATSANIAGSLAPTSIADRVGKLSGIANKGRGFVNALRRAVPQVGAGATMGALTLPKYSETPEGQGEYKLSDRAVNSGMEAMFSGGGQLLGEGLGKVARGIQTTELAKKLKGEGVELTPAQASKSSLPKIAEFIASIMPTTAKAVKQQRKESAEGFANYARNEARPEGLPKIRATGQQGHAELEDQVVKKYTDAWRSADVPTDKQLTEILEDYDVAKDLSTAGAASYKRIEDAIDRVNVRDGTPDENRAALARFDNVLRDETTNFQTGQSIDKEISDLAKRAREKLQSYAGDAAQKGLKEANDGYKQMLVMRNAGSSAKALENDGTFDIAGLRNAVKKVGGEKRAAAGTAPMQGVFDEGQAIYGDRPPLPLVDITRGVANLAASPTGALKSLAKMSLGEHQWQGKIREFWKQNPQYDGVSPATNAAILRQFEDFMTGGEDLEQPPRENNLR